MSIVTITTDKNSNNPCSSFTILVHDFFAIFFSKNCVHNSFMSCVSQYVTLCTPVSQCVCVCARARACVCVCVCVCVHIKNVIICVGGGGSARMCTYVCVCVHEYTCELLCE